MRNSSEPVLHLCNPNPLPWRAYLEPIANELNVPLVAYSVWLARLEATLTSDNASTDHGEDVERVQQNPALHLMDMWRNADLGEDMEPPGIVRLDTTKAKEVAPSLGEVRLNPTDLAKRWVRAWRESGFLPAHGESMGERHEVTNGVNGANGTHEVNGVNGTTDIRMNGVNGQL